MIARLKHHPFEVIGALITLANITLIWSYRFLPLYDFPIWLYEIKIMHSIAAEPFSSLYELSFAPIPNLGFVVPVWLMSLVVATETAGKIFLSLCGIGLPWSFWFLARRVAVNPNTPLAYAAFPFAFNILFFGGNAFLAGVIALFVMMGYYFPRLKSLVGRDFVALSFLFLMLYVVHAFAFAVGAAVFLTAIAMQRKDEIGKILLSCAPAAACSVWYAATAVPAGKTELQWSSWSLAQNVLKPIFLFIKSYGIENPIPLTLLNVLWLIVVAGFILANLIRAWKLKAIDMRFAVPAAALVMLTIALPETFLGVKHAGSRFGFCAMFLLILIASRMSVDARWGMMFLFVAAMVNGYYAFHFQKVNEQMQELHDDLTTNFNFAGKSFRPFRFDYPPPRDLRDVAAASVDPLFGVASYAALDSGGASWIFGTSLVRHTWEGRKRNPPIVHATKAALAENIFGNDARLRYDITVIVGQDGTVDSLLKSYPAKKIVKAKNWTIVEAASDSVSGENIR